MTPAVPPPPPLRTSPPSQYDVNFDGNVDYSEFMKILLDPDQYALFSVGESKAAMRKATALSDRDKVRFLYYSILSRSPTPEEMALLMRDVIDGSKESYENLTSALIATHEFIFVQ